MTQQNPFPTNKAPIMTDTERSVLPQDQMIRQAVLVGLSLVGSGFLFFALALFLAITTGEWQSIAFAAWCVLYEILHLVGISNIRHGRMNQGGWIFLGTNMFGASLGSMLFVSLGYIAVAYILVTSFFIIRYVMSKNTRIPAIIVGSVGLIVSIAAESINPAWRQTAQLMLTISPVITAALGVTFLVVIIFQARETINRSLRSKLTFWTGAIVFVLSAILVGYSAITARQEAIQVAQQDALSQAEAQAYLVKSELEIPLLTARTMANALESIKDPVNPVTMTRDQVNAMLRQTLHENPSFLGVYTLWEPNAFDGQDAEYVSAEAHDGTGRFIPYWIYGDDGNITVEALVNYETPVDGDWYLEPRRTKQEYTIAPLIYPVQGVDTTMATFTIPILVNDTFYGIAGVDAPIAFVNDIVDNVYLYEGQAKAVLLSEAGTLIAVHQHPELINQPATEVYEDFETLQPRLATGEAFISISPNGKELRVFSPIDIGETGTHWAFSLIIPFSVITAEATTIALVQAGISTVLLALALFLLWFLTGQVVRPLSELTGVANEVTAGHLDHRAEVTSSDEVGMLATAFNIMTAQLQETLQGMEQRIEERTSSLQLAAEVGQTISQVSDLDSMLSQATQLMLEQFDLYYVQIYLTNPSQTLLKLEAGTGEVGKQLMERGHSLPLSIASINGRAAFEKHPVVISDTAESSTFRKNPLLPDTRGEMALPLIVGEKVVGVLDLQTRYPGKLTEELVPAYEALAGQLAVAIQNANLLAEAERARADLEAQARRRLRVSWDEHLDAIHKPEQIGFVFNQNEVVPFNEVDVSQSYEEANTLAMPISLVGEELGALVVELENEAQKEKNTELVSIVARQVAQQIENLRLLESADRYRHEAEEAARRQTVEGWQAYVATRTTGNLGYLYDLKEVRPHSNGQDDATALTLPLKAHDETVGKLSVQGLTPDDRESFELANAVAERLGSHIESLRLFEETRRGQVELDKRARELAAVAKVSTASSQELDVDKMLTLVAELTQRQFDLYHAHIFTYNEITEELEIRACGWKEGDEHAGTHGTTAIPLAQEQSLVARAARNRQAVVVNDVHNEPGWLPNPLLPDTQAEMAIPLLIGDRVLGVLDVQKDYLNAFTQEDVNIKTTLASQVAIALQNAYSYAQAQKQAERESLLNTINQKIQSATSVEAVLQIAARELGHALGAPMTIAQLSLKDQN